jgi:hypothetical protein
MLVKDLRYISPPKSIFRPLTPTSPTLVQIIKKAGATREQNVAIAMQQTDTACYLLDS